MNVGQSFSLVFALFYMFLISFTEGQLRVGFYSQTCPNAEAIVSSVVRAATQGNPRMPPILLRLHFHDCFVEGCDGSILISGSNSEKRAFAHQGVEGFAEINRAKAELETRCPGVVSCADIVAMAARDAIAMAGGPTYDVETGRRDGRVSSVSLADNMPDVDDSIDTLKLKFRNKGLTEEQLVLLSGAHTIGTSACFFLPKRLYNFSGKNDSDPKIDPKLLLELKSACPQNGDSGVRISLDPISRDKFDDQILRNIKNQFAVIASDAKLYDDNTTRQVVDFYVESSQFTQDFATAMVQLGRLDVKVASNGEIRRVCDQFN